MSYKDSEIGDINVVGCQNTNEILAVVNNVIPDWLISQSKKYDKELSKFDENWKKVCKMIGCQKDSIFIVEFSPATPNDPDRKKILELCDHLTKHGNVVRDYRDFELCSECQCVKLTIAASEKLKREYSEKCKVCI